LKTSWMKEEEVNARDCRKEMRERFRVGRIISEWEEGRTYFKERELEIEKMEERKEERGT